MKSELKTKKSSSISADTASLATISSKTTGEKRSAVLKFGTKLDATKTSNETKAVRKKSLKVFQKSMISTQGASVMKAGSPQVAQSLIVALQEALDLGRILFEKCELGPARAAFLKALDFSRQTGDVKKIMESLSFLLRLAGEALDEMEIQKWESELDAVMRLNPSQVPPKAWYCKGAVARHKGEYKIAQRFYHRALKGYRARIQTDPSQLTEFVQCWQLIAMVLFQRGLHRRSIWVLRQILKRYEGANLKGINGSLYMLHGAYAEKSKNIEEALKWYQKAHAAFLSEHNWYHHLYVLFAYARVARIQKNYSQAYWYLDLVEKTTAASEFGAIRKEILTEKHRLENDAIDLLIDSRKAVVKTRESGTISLRKQYVLLNILEALTAAHGKDESDAERGLSKAEIIEKVWKESYRPEAHDNKLYYNINRLRKLIEPDMRQPQYLLNWKEGYRLAPGLKVHLVGGNKLLREGEV